MAARGRWKGLGLGPGFTIWSDDVPFPAMVTFRPPANQYGPRAREMSAVETKREANEGFIGNRSIRVHSHDWVMKLEAMPWDR